MQWLTIPQIKRRSKTAKGALKVSYEHWNQLCTATAKELRAKYEETDGLIADADYCGLCTYKNDKGLICADHCVFRAYCPHGLYNEASDNIDYWYEQKGCTWWDWKRACKAVRDKLKELMELK